MPSYSKLDVVLVLYPSSDLTSSKVRPAIVINAAHVSQDVFVVALTSKTSDLLPGEFVLSEWKTIGLNVETAVKRGIYTVKNSLIRKRVGTLAGVDAVQLEESLRDWLDLPQSTKKGRPNPKFARPSFVDETLIFPSLIARSYSRFIREMLTMRISLGHTASHSPSFGQKQHPS